MTNVIKIYRDLKGDKSIWLIVTLLLLVSILAVYSSIGSIAYKDHGGNTEFYLLQQVIFIGLGVGMMWLMYKMDYRKFARLAPILLVIAVTLLLYTFFFGKEVNSAKRWITIPWIDKTFQTSDFAKIALIVYLARTIATKQDVIKDLKSAALPLFLPIILVCGIIAPNNLSTAALLFMTCMLMLFIGRISLKFVFILLLLGVIAGLLITLMGVLFPDVVRLETWIHRVSDFVNMTDESFQVQQAKIAIANGEWFGVGPGKSLQKNYLPFSFSDCIYAIICEEFGLIGGLAILGLYFWLLVRCVQLVTKSPKAFGAILAMGLCLDIVINAFANISVSVQLVPATGLTLPLISMGGTSLILTCISFGIILSVSKFVEEYSATGMLSMEKKLANEGAH
ncbi:MAG: FtsW/RodA/SpoVE family cell cycle protein [Saprospiraceae bacterium]|nr:FtsW/RodA/SpoVE family cell cycle protein [Saprospiraceae bacterium]MBK8633729.1 FtsW/RodA/SpoVE family cell cycle protein [Saprospiraceae bacterium]MBP7641881.1 FtsW/RodA/SpoVE family cell cycle protein [Saprospiraceae bacterium]